MDLHQSLPQNLLQIFAAPALQQRLKESLQRISSQQGEPASCCPECQLDTNPSWPTRPRELAVMYRQARDEGDENARQYLLALVVQCQNFDEFWIQYWRLVVKDDEVALFAVRKFLPQFKTSQVRILCAFWRCYGEKHPAAGDLILQRIIELLLPQKLTSLPV